MEKLEHIYDINELVDKFYDKINEMTAENNKSRGVKRADIMSKDRKTFINNFNDVCISIDRKPETVSAYIAKELKMNTSITANGMLIIHGTYKKKIVDDLVIKYITDFVQCPLCKACTSTINKVDRINFLECKKCHAKTAVDVYF